MSYLSQIKLKKGGAPMRYIVGVLAVLIFLAGCSSQANQSVPFDPMTGKHPSNWLADHGSVYENDPSVCQQCHGQDLQGGVSGVSCGSVSFDGTACHGHPQGWDDPSQHGAAAKDVPSIGATFKGFSICQHCHGTDFSGGFSGKDCFSCHGVHAPHPQGAEWKTPQTPTHSDTNPVNASVCAQCHQGQQGTPGCFNGSLCHTYNDVCANCHGFPPDGNQSPNRAGAHTAHNNAFPLALKEDCSACHFGYLNTYNDGNVDISINVAYFEKNSTGTFTNNTCSGVRCHGGKQTPQWYGGTINVNTQCDACHSYGSGQFNAYHSGKHYKHVFKEGKKCTDCHDTQKLAQYHFNDLQDTSMPDAGRTLLDRLNYNPKTHSCNPPCHGGENWF
ncbi:MAG: CxxxxCH/CxxCH domain-containing protein [Nitrospirae bacterium]|nr:MAG: CxxxxCH/CxxCH domain-containing protein [Nitrospirota bacterium]